MTTFNRQDFINSVKNIINRVSNMRDKVKALKLLDSFQENNENEYYMFIFGDEELWDIYSDVTMKWKEISCTLTEKESDIYSNSLPDEIVDKDWCKKQNELLQSRIKEAKLINIIFE